MQEAHGFPFEQHFCSLIPQITLNGLSHQLKSSPKGNDSESVPHEIMPKLPMLLFNRKSTMMTTYQTQNYLLYAFLLVQSGVMSTLTLHMMSNSNIEYYSVRSLKPVYIQMLCLKFVASSSEELCLAAGTACGKLLIYQNFDTSNVNIESIQFTSRSVVQLSVPSFQNKIFALTSAGSIYLLDIKQHRVCYQFQCSLPQLTDNRLFLLLDQQENIVCAAFGHGRVIVWDLAGIKSRWINSKDETEMKKMAKKRGKEKVNRNVVFKHKANLLACVAEGIQWISLHGTLLLVMTPQAMFKVISVSLDSSNELYFVLNQFSLVNKLETHTFEKVSSIQLLSDGLLVSVNCWKDEKMTQLLSSRLDHHIIDEQWIQNKIKIKNVKFEDAIEEAHWDQTKQHIVCRTSRQYALS